MSRLFKPTIEELYDSEKYKSCSRSRCKAQASDTDTILLDEIGGYVPPVSSPFFRCRTTPSCTMYTRRSPILSLLSGVSVRSVAVLKLNHATDTLAANLDRDIMATGTAGRDSFLVGTPILFPQRPPGLQSNSRSLHSIFKLYNG
jgi:hypothetical protein